MKKIYFLPVVTFISVFLLFSQSSFTQTEENIKSSLPKMLGLNNWGNEYYFTIPPCFEDESGGHENFIKIFITSSVSTQVVVEVEGSGYYETRKTVANDVIEFNLTPAQGQPYVKAGRDPNVAEAVFPGKAIHIYSDSPILVYCVVRYYYTSDGFFAIPVSALGKEYIVAGWNVDAMFKAVWNYKLPNTSGIVAAFDDTRVRFTLGGNVMTKTAGGMTPGQSKEAVLRKGDVWMFSTDADEADLTGSTVIANKPVAVVTGNMCANIPTGNQWCDYTVEMDIPTYTWGYTVFVPKVPNRKYASIIRIFAKEPDTKYYKDGKLIGELKSAGGTEGNGFFTMRMVGFEEKPRSIVISGDKPIGVTLYNCGVQEDGYPLPNSDPFVMSLLSYENYFKDITFCTPAIMGGQGFPENYINLVYETDSAGNMPDHFEFANVVNGQFNWVKLNTRFPGTDEQFSYKYNGKNFALKLITLPGDGVYKIRAKTEFAAYSFGYSYCDSYGYPTGATITDIEKTDTICPVPSYLQHCDGSVDGTVTDMPDDAKIRSNLAMLLMDDGNSYNYEFDYAPFIPGETRTTNWKLHVIDLMQNAKATLFFTDRRGNDTTIVIEYYANTDLSMQPVFWHYGKFKLGDQTVNKDFVLKNESLTSPVKIEDIDLLNGNRHFTINLMGQSFPMLLAPDGIIQFSVQFEPSEYGTFSDNIIVKDSCKIYHLTELTAMVPKPGGQKISVADVDFGQIKVDSTAKLRIVISNIGTSDLSIDSISGPYLPVYTVDFSPVIIPPASNKSFDISFTPAAQQNYYDFIWFYSNTENSGDKNYTAIKGSGYLISDVEDDIANDVSVFPNPADKNVTIRLSDNNLNIKSLQLIDEKGVSVYQNTEVNSSEFIIRIGHYPSGNYFIKLITSAGEEIIKNLKVVK